MKKIYTVRKLTIADATIIQSLARKCSPLEIHTEYTYWVCTNYFGDCSFILEYNNTPIGYIMAIENASTVFIWQIGIVKEHRGKGLAKLLIGACVDLSKQKRKNIETTIAIENKESYRAFQRYCKGCSVDFICLGDVKVLDAQGNIYETERLYSIILGNPIP